MQKDKFSYQEVKESIEFIRNFYEDKQEKIPNYTESEITNVVACCNRIYIGYLDTFEKRLIHLLYNLCKGHYLSNGNGNKRITFAMSIMFLQKENKKINLKLLQNFIDGFAKGTITKEQAIEKLKSENVFF